MRGEGCTGSKESLLSTVTKALYGSKAALVFFVCLLVFALFAYNFLIDFVFINTVYCLFSLTQIIFLNVYSPKSVNHRRSSRMGLWLQQVWPLKTAHHGKQSKAEDHFQPMSQRCPEII